MLYYTILWLNSPVKGASIKCINVCIYVKLNESYWAELSVCKSGAFDFATYMQKVLENVSYSAPATLLNCT